LVYVSALIIIIYIEVYIILYKECLLK